jgi:hypothetical protein
MKMKFKQKFQVPSCLPLQAHDSDDDNRDTDYQSSSRYDDHRQN